MSCAICEKKKEKRYCPAIHGRICPQCCGEQRETTLDCPESCTYLLQAYAQEPGRTEQELAGEEIFADVELARQFYYEREPLLVGLLYALAQLAAAHRDWNDRDLIGALTAFTRSIRRMSGSGLIYDESGTNPIHQAVAEHLQRQIEQYRALEQKQLGFFTLKDSDVVRALVFLVRSAQSGSSGRPRTRKFLASLAARFPQQPAKGIADPSASRLIVP